MRDILIAAMRGREADSNPSACYLQRLEIGGGDYQYPYLCKQR